MRRQNFLVLFGLLFLSSSCKFTDIKIQNTEACTVAGRLSNGAVCANTLKPDTRDLSLQEFLTFLEPDQKTGRGGAICQSAADWNKNKTLLEQACKMLGSQCSYELQQAIKSVNENIGNLTKKGSK